MKVTKFRGQVNDQTFDNVQDYNKAITEAIEKNNLKSASSNTWVEEFEEISKSERPTPTLVNGTMEELKKVFEYYIGQFNTGINEDNIRSFIGNVRDILKTSLDNNDPNHQMYVDYVDDELEKLTQSLDEFCDKVTLYSNELQVLDNQLEDKLNTYKKLAEEIKKLEQRQREMNSDMEKYNKVLNDWTLLEGLMGDLISTYGEQESLDEEPIEPQKEPQKPSWMSNSHYNFLKEIFG
jgi:DNA repair exonuclease SbcCD ATPase subunit